LNKNKQIMKNVACYIRVSTEEQARHGLSLEAQKETLEKYARDNDLKIYDFYIDDGITARKRLGSRKAFQRMLEDVKADRIDLIIFIKLDRWFRNIADYYKTMEVLDTHGVHWKATEEDYDTTTSNGRLHLNIKLSIAQNESDQTSDRINYVFANKRKNGLVISGSKKYGFDIVDQKYVANKEEQENLIEFFKYFVSIQGDTRKAFAYYKDHFPFKSFDTYKKIIQDTSYIGKYQLYRKKEFLDDYCPAIVPKELWDQVQEVRHKAPRKPRDDREIPVTLFNGFMYCPICNMRLSRDIKHYVHSIRDHLQVLEGSQAWKKLHRWI